MVNNLIMWKSNVLKSTEMDQLNNTKKIDLTRLIDRNIQTNLNDPVIKIYPKHQMDIACKQIRPNILTKKLSYLMKKLNESKHIQEKISYGQINHMNLENHNEKNNNKEEDDNSNEKKNLQTLKRSKKSKLMKLDNFNKTMEPNKDYCGMTTKSLIKSTLRHKTSKIYLQTLQNHLKQRTLKINESIIMEKPLTSIRNMKMKKRKIEKKNISERKNIVYKSGIKTLKAIEHRLNDRISNLPRPAVLHTYLSYKEIIQYLVYIENRYKDFIKIHTIGYSFEKRPIKAIEIDWNCDRNLRACSKQYLKSNILYTKKLVNPMLEMNDAPIVGRNMIFIEGGTHAREWIAVTVALHCIYQLTEKNIYHRDLLRKLSFFIIPLVNPDGYEYTRTTNSRWRKNRRPLGSGKYIGTDCNRNFDFHWENSDSKAKRNTFQGEKPFSEPETRALAHVLHQLAPKILMFLSLHSYGQCIMYPWGYCKEDPQNISILDELANVGRNTIKSFNGRFYRVGTIAKLTKRTISGSIVDYVYGVVKVPLSLVMELPSREFGFQPPSRLISPIGHESWYGIREMCKHAFTLKLIYEEQWISNANEGNLKNIENNIVSTDKSNTLKITRTST